MTHARLRDFAEGFDLQTDLWWVAMMFLGLMIAVLSAIAFPPFGGFWIWVLVGVRFSIALCLAQQPWGDVFRRLLGFGVAAGAFMIFADHLCVSWRTSAQRVYPNEAASALLSSPLYVPLLWATTIVEWGYAITRLYGLAARQKPSEMALGLAMGAGGFLAAILTASQEFLAVRAQWWGYAPGVFLGDACPFYVVLANFFLFVGFLPVFGRYLASGGTRTYAAVRYGAVFAAVAFFSFAVAHMLVERGP